MRIVEKDFIMEPASYGLFNITFLKKVKDKETGEVQIKPSKISYGCTLSSCIRKIVRHRVNTQFESESIYLLDALKEIIKLDKEFNKLCKEPFPEDFDTGE